MCSKRLPLRYFLFFIIVVGGLYSGVYLLSSRSYPVDQVIKLSGNHRIFFDEIKVTGTFDTSNFRDFNDQGATRFEIKSDKGEALPVLYKGNLPEDLKDGMLITVEGQYTVEKVFISDKITIRK